MTNRKKKERKRERKKEQSQSKKEKKIERWKELSGLFQKGLKLCALKVEVCG